MSANKILVTVCVIQFAIISLWISTPPVDDAVADAAAHLPSLKDPVVEPFHTDHTTTSPDALERQVSGAAALKGVAAVVMLHSPKWFQRRYTVMIQNVYNNIPRDWVVQVFYINNGGSKVGIEINPGLQRMASDGKIILTEIPPRIARNKKRRSDYFLVPWLWENMLADKVLLFGGNSVLCSNSLLTINNFTSFDYIGSPWGHFKGRGGSGEISLRSRKVMLDAINIQLTKKNISSGFTDEWGLEDNFFVQSIINFIKNGRPLKLAEKEDTLLFSASGSHSSPDVFSGSGTLAGLTDKEREDFFAYCPEIKVIFPSLHNPGCFGANVKKDQCAASICALRPDKKSC